MYSSSWCTKLNLLDNITHINKKNCISFSKLTKWETLQFTAWRRWWFSGGWLESNLHSRAGVSIANTVSANGCIQRCTWVNVDEENSDTCTASFEPEIKTCRVRNKKKVWLHHIPHLRGAIFTLILLNTTQSTRVHRSITHRRNRRASRRQAARGSTPGCPRPARTGPSTGTPERGYFTEVCYSSEKKPG